MMFGFSWESFWIKWMRWSIQIYIYIYMNNPRHKQNAPRSMIIPLQLHAQIWFQLSYYWIYARMLCVVYTWYAYTCTRSWHVNGMPILGVANKRSHVIIYVIRFHIHVLYELLWSISSLFRDLRNNTQYACRRIELNFNCARSTMTISPFRKTVRNENRIISINHITYKCRRSNFAIGKNSYLFKMIACSMKQPYCIWQSVATYEIDSKLIGRCGMFRFIFHPHVVRMLWLTNHLDQLLCAASNIQKLVSIQWKVRILDYKIVVPSVFITHT